MESLLLSNATAADHIKITREVFLEGGEPSALIQTREQGYVIVGKGFRAPSDAWATRVDRDGNVQWRHVVRGAIAGPAEGATYTSAAMLQDDSAILCGYQWIEDGSRPNQAGLVTHIDKAGRVISERVVFPLDDKSYRLNYLLHCIPFGDGVVMFGTTSRVWGDTAPRHSKEFGWIVALDAQGKVKWEKLTSGLEPSGRLESYLVLQNGDLIVANNGPRPEPPTEELDTTKMTRIDINGGFHEQRTALSNVVFVKPVTPDLHVRFMSGKQITASMTTWNARLQGVKRITGSIEAIVPKRAYILPDGSVSIFGYDHIEHNAGSASIQWLSADLNKQEKLLFQPTFASVWVADAVPTGKPAEFATIRQVLPGVKHLIGPDEKRNGMVLTFVQFN